MANRRRPKTTDKSKPRVSAGSVAKTFPVKEEDSSKSSVHSAWMPSSARRWEIFWSFFIGIALNYFANSPWVFYVPLAALCALLLMSQREVHTFIMCRAPQATYYGYIISWISIIALILLVCFGGQTYISYEINAKLKDGQKLEGELKQHISTESNRVAASSNRIAAELTFLSQVEEQDLLQRFPMGCQIFTMIQQNGLGHAELTSVKNILPKDCTFRQTHSLGCELDQSLE